MRPPTWYTFCVRVLFSTLCPTYPPPTAVGTPVVLQGKGFRVDQGGPARAADPYAQPQPQPGAVRVSDTY